MRLESGRNIMPGINDSISYHMFNGHFEAGSIKVRDVINLGGAAVSQNIDQLSLTASHEILMHGSYFLKDLLNEISFKDLPKRIEIYHIQIKFGIAIYIQNTTF